MYAIVKVGGKQYRVESGDSIVVDRMSANEGDKVELEPLLFRPDDKDAVFEGAELDKIKVEATVTGHERGKKVHVLKYKPKRGYRRRSGARADLTRLAIGDLKQGGRRAAAKKPAAEKKPTAAGKPAAEASGAEATAAETKQKPARKAPAKKAGGAKPAAGKATAAKKPAAKKPAAEKGAAKKPAAKKPAAKKPAAKTKKES